MDNLRLFVGLALPKPVSDWLSVRMDALAERLSFRRWTHPADLHVTLHFLGETPAGRVEAVRRALAETAAEAAPFALALAGPGTFGPPETPRVLWCGLTEPAAPGALAALHAALGARLAAAGCALEARPFRAHVTLARGGGAGCGQAAVAAAWRDACGAADAGHAGSGGRSTPGMGNAGWRESPEPSDRGGAGASARRSGPDAGGARALAAAAPQQPAASAWTADRIVLFRSHLGRRPSYERLAEYRFGR